MLKRLNLKNFTVFHEADFRFSKALNVMVGENGTGKTHVLKAAYSSIAAVFEESRKANPQPPTKSMLQSKIADKLENVFRPEYLGRLARRKRGRERCEVELEFAQSAHNLSFAFASNSKREVSVTDAPSAWIAIPPAYLPTRELLSIYPNFVTFYEGHYLDFDETWRDTCVLLGHPLQKGPREAHIKKLLEPLEYAMNGQVELDRNGRFYLRTAEERLEIPLVAEGQRKLAMLARLIATGALLEQGYLFWDEPEANLNPVLIRQIAKSIVAISRTGVQVFIATHSLFLLRELEIQTSSAGEAIEGRYFGLQKTEEGSVRVLQSANVAEIGDIAALEEELSQSDRFVEMQGAAL
jgi:predicted ATPase